MAAHPPKSPDSLNPFVIGHPAEGAHFADREVEVARIKRAFSDPSSRLVVYGERRLGKSSAIAAAAHQRREEGGVVAVVDLAKVTSAEAAAQRVLSAVQQVIGQRWKDAALKLVGRLRPGAVSLSAGLDAQGIPTVSFNVAPTTAEPSPQLFTDVLDAVDAELAERGMFMGLALDEFQRLRQWCGDDIDWPLKAMFERHRNIGYVLAGSERAMIRQMLDNKKAGLWKVVDVLDMSPIPVSVFAPWLSDRAHATGVSWDASVAASVVQIAGPRTRDVVQLARVLWDLTHDHRKATIDDVVTAVEQLVNEQGALHLREWTRQSTDIARKILMLIADNPRTQLTSSDTITRYRLGPKSSVSRNVRELVSAEVLVDIGKDGYAFDDPFFKRWVQLNALEDIGRPVPMLRDLLITLSPR